MEILENEVFKPVIGFEDRYLVSNKGRVWSIITKRFLRAGSKNGYQFVDLFRNNKGSQQYVHRLVAYAFIENDDPELKTQVNHKDENKANNNVDNLEWVSAKENLNWGTRNMRSALKRGTKIKCVETGVIYPTIAECARQIGGDKSFLARCLRDGSKKAYGYHWEYA